MIGLMRLARVRLAGLAMLGALFAGGNSSAEIRLGDDFTIGPDKYQNNLVEGGFSPSPRMDFHARWGIARHPSPDSYERNSIGAGGWVRLTSKLGVALDWTRYAGERVKSVRLPSLAAGGAGEERQTVETVGGEIQMDLVFPEDPGMNGQGIRLDFGMAEAWHRFPVWIENWSIPGGDWERWSPDLSHEMRDRIYSAGVRFYEGESTLEGKYSRHHYRFPWAPAGAEGGVVRRIVDTMTASLESTVKGLPRYESLIALHQVLPDAVFIDFSYGYTRMDADGALVRTTATGIGRRWGRGIELRLGTSWVKAHGSTRNYKTFGGTLYF